MKKVKELSIDERVKAMNFKFPKGGYETDGFGKIRSWENKEPQPTDDDLQKIIKSNEFIEYNKSIELDMCYKQRLGAYKRESDFLKTEAEFDAIKNKKTPDYTKWINKVEEIKTRFPKP